MAMLGTAFNANEVEPGQARDFSAMPPDKYLASIVNSEMRAIKPKFGQDPNGNYGNYLWLEIEIMQGEFERRKLFENVVLDHPNPQTVEIARQTLRAICFACNKPTISDSEELHGIPFVVDLVVEQDRRNRSLPAGQPPYPPVNRVKAYLPADADATASYVPAAPKMAAQAPAAGGYAATGGGVGAPTVMPRPAATGGGLPWGKK